MKFKLRATLTFLILILISSTKALGQEVSVDSIARVTLNEVEVTAYRAEVNMLRTPLSLSVTRFDSAWSGPRRSLQEYLENTPGIFTLNSSNYAQDLRISIRGFGAQSAFGIRGLKLIVDGIPETTPDGQGQLDNLPLALIREISVIRGPSALRYGNASGGIIAIETEAPSGETQTEFNLEGGGFGQRQFGLTQQWGDATNAYLLHYTHQRIENFRQHSSVENNILNFRSRHRFGERTTVSFQANHTSSPLALDPGGLTLTEFGTDPSAARALNLTFDASERLTHSKIGASLRHKFSSATRLSSYGFYSTRDFDAKLPFESGGQVSLLRSYGGQGLEITHRISPKLKFQAGYDWANQRDHRQRYQNLQGERGTLDLDQFETFSGFGGYVIAELQVRNTLFSGGARYDRNRLGLEDRYFSDGNDSDTTSLNAVSPQFSFSTSLFHHLILFGGYSRSFETPTLSELAVNPTGDSGFNNTLGIQSAGQIELGLRHQSQNTRASLAVYHINSTNELVAYEIAEFPGRTFYQNAGRSTRQGLEFEGYHQLSSVLRLNANYTYSNNGLTSNTTEKLELPGIPTHQGLVQLSASITPAITLTLQRTYRGSLFADSQNAVQIPEVFIDQLVAQWHLKAKGTASNYHFTLGINNLGNQTYADNIRINAFGGRFYETALPRQLYIGVTGGF